MALWRSGYAAVCKTAYTGSIPVGASIIILYINTARYFIFCTLKKLSLIFQRPYLPIIPHHNHFVNNDNGIQRAPLSFVRGGLYHYSDGNLAYGGLDYRGSYGFYWVPRVNNANYADRLDFGFARLRPQNLIDKGEGLSLRCLAR